MKNDVQGAYDQIAAEFGPQSFEDLRHKPYDLHILELFAARVRGLVCDLGCGAGAVARYLHDRGTQVIGLDISAGMLNEARRLSPDIRFVKGNMKKLPVDDETWGGIVGFYCLCHLPRKKVLAVLSELRRVLEPSGWLLLAFHVGQGTFHKEQWGQAQVSVDTTFFSAEEIKGYLTATGFSIEGWRLRPPYLPRENPNWRGFVLAQKQSARLLPAAPIMFPPLVQAALCESMQRFEAILNDGASPDEASQDGTTSMHVAAGDGRIELVELLLRRGARVDSTLEDGRTAFHLAVYLGQMRVARRLIEAGVDPRVADAYGNTPLHHACTACQVEMGSWLLSLKVDSSARNRRGETPYVCAYNSRCSPLVARLESSRQVYPVNSLAEQSQRLMEGSGRST